MQVAAVALYVSLALLQREDGLLLLCLKPQHLVVEGFVWLTQTISVAKELFSFALCCALFLSMGFLNFTCIWKVLVLDPC